MKGYIIAFFWLVLRLDLIESTNSSELKENAHIRVTCPFLISTSDRLIFSYVMEPKDIGYSVELIFSDSVNIIEANNSKPAPVAIHEVSKNHWILSEQVVKGAKYERKATFTASYQMDESKASIYVYGVIYNGEVLCGTGNSHVYTPQNDEYDGRGLCKPFKTLCYENATTFSLRENFHSRKIGLVVDIYFSSDVSKVDEVSNVRSQKRGKRHYTFYNSGFITSEDDPIELSFTAHHVGTPQPRFSAVVINDRVICGFAAFLDVSKLDQNENLLESIDALSISADIISACGLLVTIATGVFAWKLVSQIRPDSSILEPVYSVPKRL